MLAHATESMECSDTPSWKDAYVQFAWALVLQLRSGLTGGKELSLTKLTPRLSTVTVLWLARDWRCALVSVQIPALFVWLHIEACLTAIPKWRHRKVRCSESLIEESRTHLVAKQARS